MSGGGGGSRPSGGPGYGMGGGSGYGEWEKVDGKWQKKSDTKTASQPMKTVQPFMPGIADMLAQQLAAGGYGDQASNLASMMQFYSPMQVPDYNPPPAPTPDPTTTPDPASGGGTGGYGNGGYGAGGSQDLLSDLKKRNRTGGLR